MIVKNAKTITLTNLNIGPCKGQGILIQDSSGVSVSQSRIATSNTGPCCDNFDGVYVYQSQDVILANNWISRSEDNIMIFASSRVRISDNELLDPIGDFGTPEGADPISRGVQIQVAGTPWNRASTDITIENNILKTSAPDAMTTDHINVSGSTRVKVLGNKVQGKSPGAPMSGCGITIDYQTADVLVQKNSVSGGPQCSYVVGNDHRNVTIDNNDADDASNVSYTIWNPKLETCSGIEFTNNRSGSRARYPFWYDPTHCSGVREQGNSWQVSIFPPDTGDAGLK